MKVETNIKFHITFDDELNEAYDKSTFEVNLKRLRKFDEETKKFLEEEYGSENTVVTSVFVQD